jgi:hypothetical protein
VAESDEHGSTRFRRAFDHRTELDTLLAQLYIAAANATDVEQVVDQAGQVCELPIHYRDRTRDASVVVRRETQKLEAGLKGSEGVAELVRERRQELVLASVGLLLREPFVVALPSRHRLGARELLNGLLQTVRGLWPGG